ncbi:alpha/beta fold hydrolase [Ostreibacterium oceani]|uniref:Alpha/beta fold hydrolase n=1 Tax=Ostreibacterium oceani TaxID=2654998 RepID=A0A6N7EQN4_9GAMM|nr:alpha/beta hydrolase [Ostreibacterium oceani]MPV85164.1 alpha/beta fold hydrolase [Ostreibacterium oceani]
MYYQKQFELPTSDTLVLLHSGGMAGVEWQPQIAQLSKKFNLLVPDLPGHGQSPIADDEVLSVAMMGNAVADMVVAEGLSKVHLLGSSMGGAVALWLAIHRPNLVDKLIVYRIAHRKNHATHAQTNHMADPEYWRKFGLHNWLSELHLPQGGRDAWQRVIANVSKVLHPETTDHNHALADLAQIQSDTLLICGDRDPLVPLSVLMAMHETIPRCALWVLPNATHITATNTWRAKSFADEVIRFIMQPLITE